MLHQCGMAYLCIVPGPLWEHHQIIIPSEAEGFDDNK